MMHIYVLTHLRFDKVRRLFVLETDTLWSELVRKTFGTRLHWLIIIGSGQVTQYTTDSVQLNSVNSHGIAKYLYARDGSISMKILDAYPIQSQIAPYELVHPIVTIWMLEPNPIRSKAGDGVSEKSSCILFCFVPAPVDIGRKALPGMYGIISETLKSR